MRINFVVIDTNKERFPGGQFGGDGEWRVLECTIKGANNDATFTLAINEKEKEIDILPTHPDHADTLIRAFSQAFKFKGART